MGDRPDRDLPEEDLAALQRILSWLDGPGATLPPVLFRFLTEIAATPNIDLLVLDDAKRVLLAWRADAFGAGWHVPGSIIRHREEIGHRIDRCAAEEFGCPLAVSAGPAALVQIFDDRGHSVSLCHTAALRGVPARRVVAEGEPPAPGDLCWFAALPEALYPSHYAYRAVIDRLRADRLEESIPVFTQHVGERDAAQRSPDGAIATDGVLTRLA